MSKVLKFSADIEDMNKKSNFDKRHQLGFTLIELIVVIIILGILASVALPRFVNLQREARIAKLQAARGSVLAASALVHATAVARGGVADTGAMSPCPAGGGTANNTVAGAGTVCTESGVINMVNAYPAVTAINTAGLLSMAGLTGSFNPTATDLQNEGYTYTVVGTRADFGIIGATTPSTCIFSYTESAAANAAPVVSALNTAGC